MEDEPMTGDTVAPSRPMRVAELMRRDFISVSPDASLDEARQLMRLARLRHLVVVRHRTVVGILSYRSLLESAIDDRGAETEGRRQRRARPSVATLMAAEPECVASDRSLEEVAAQLFRLNLGCLPVVEAAGEPVEAGGEPPALIGIVTERDLLRAAYDPWFRARHSTADDGERSARERDTS
jgi:acetoin utilization protein AcuB